MSDYKEPKRPLEISDLNEAHERIAALEGALIPFAKIAVAMEDARMRLAAAGREGEPAGGHWVNNLHSTAMTPTEVYFYTALQISGRKHVEERMLHDMDRMVELTIASQEAAANVDNGGRSDH